MSFRQAVREAIQRLAVEGQEPWFADARRQSSRLNIRIDKHTQVHLKRPVSPEEQTRGIPGKG